MTTADLPTVNAILNSICTLLLAFGYVLIKQGKAEKHRAVMISAISVSALFLVSYLIYHYQVGSVPYPYHNWTRPVYFAILIPHILLAGVMVPFILIAVWHAWRANFEKHKRLVKIVWPVWMFVSISGVIIYLMLYHL